jgi:DnaK suppressor protein
MVFRVMELYGQRWNLLVAYAPFIGGTVLSPPQATASKDQRVTHMAAKTRKKTAAKKTVAEPKAKAKPKVTAKVAVKRKAAPKVKAKAKAKPKSVPKPRPVGKSRASAQGAKKATTPTKSKAISTTKTSVKPKNIVKPRSSARPRPASQPRPVDSPFKNFVPYEPARGEIYMSAAQFDHFRDILLKWRQELMEEVDRTVHHMQDEAANFPDPADRATQEEEFSIELRTRDRERKLIKKIDQTVDRIDQEDYGYCDTCGVEIGLRRLEARPTATQCVDCKTLDEIKERQTHG